MLGQYEVNLDAERHPVMVCEKRHEYVTTRVDCAEKAVGMLETCFHAGSKAEEHVYMIALDVRKEVLGLFDVSHGQIGFCFISPREVYLRALLAGASSIVLAHNHPSGDATPSEDDFTFASRMIEAGKAVAVELDDNIIIASGGSYYSFKEAGRL